MVKYKIQIILLLLILIVVKAFPQNDQIESRKQELSKLKEEIQKLEKELEQKNKNEKKSLTDLNNISKQSFLLNKLIADYRSQEANKQAQIEIQTQNISALENEINTLKKNYAKYVTANYKYGRYNEWESIVDAESFQQAVVRLEYLKRFSISRSNDLKKFEENKKNLISAKQKLEIEKKEKHQLAVQKENEESELKKKLVEKKSIINDIKKDKKILQKSVAEKRKSEQKIRDLIVRLVEEAEKRRKEEELKKSTVKVDKEKKTIKETEGSEFNFDLTTSKFSSFSELKGNLNWPITKGKVVRGYGESLNPNIKTLTVNYGIDIKASGELGVKCVAEGVVSAVEWLPGYGTVLIVSHRGNYRTVYGHLGEIFVKEGDKLVAGSMVGKIGESVEGNILHFEIWNGRQNVDPMGWLKK